jgi:hypothetical protein
VLDFGSRRFRHVQAVKLGDVGTVRQVNPDFVLTAFAGVIKAKPLAHFPGLNPYRGIITRFIGRGPPKHVDSDSALLEALSLALQRALHHVAEEILRALAGAKALAVKDAVERRADLRLG